MRFYNRQTELRINWGEAANALRQAKANLCISCENVTEARREMLFSEAAAIITEIRQTAEISQSVQNLDSVDEAFDNSFSLCFSTDDYKMNIPRDYVPTTLARAGIFTKEWSKLHDLISVDLLVAHREAKVAMDHVWESSRINPHQYDEKPFENLVVASNASDNLKYISTNLLAEANFLLNYNGVSATLLLEKTVKASPSNNTGDRSTRSIVYTRPIGLRFALHGNGYSNADDYHGASCPPIVEAVLAAPGI